MKNDNKIFLGLSLAVLSGAFISPLLTDNELYDPTRMGKIFFFVQWMLIVIPLGLFIFIRHWKQPMDKLSLFVLFWFAWIFIRGKFGGIWHDEKFFCFAGCFAFYFLSSTILNAVRRKRPNLLIIPALVITMVAGIEAVMGLLQLYGGFHIYHGTYKVTGTFFNPAPYAGFLLASLPWALLLCSKRLPLTLKGECSPLNGRFFPKRGVRGVSDGRHNLMHGIALFYATLKKQNPINYIIYWVGFITIFLIIVVIPSTQSRAAYLGLLAVALVWIFFLYKPLLYLKRILNTRLKRQLAFTIIPLTFILLFTGLYLFKKDSADGRLLIWKVALQTIKERPLAGHGFNTAQATLAPAQAAYFANGNGNESEKMLAGSVRWAFNEPLQAASETGLIGALLLLLVTGYALFCKIPQPISRSQYLQIGAARASVAGVLVFGCFSYPFYSLPVTLLFFFSLAVLSFLKAKAAKPQSSFVISCLKVPILAGIILLGIFYLIQTPKLKKAYWLWDEASTLYQMSAYKEANESYAEALPILKQNGLFLQQYAKNMALEDKHTEAIKILKEAENYYKDEFSYIAMGDAYKATENYQKAEEQYLLAANMVPHKFYPLYLCARLFNETGQKEKAMNIAKEVLNKNSKVDSKAIEEIKTEMLEILAANKNTTKE